MTEPQFSTIAHEQHLVGHVDGIPVYVDNTCEKNKVYLITQDYFWNSGLFESRFIIGTGDVWDSPDIKKTLRNIIPDTDTTNES